MYNFQKYGNPHVAQKFSMGGEGFSSLTIQYATTISGQADLRQITRNPKTNGRARDCRDYQRFSRQQNHTPVRSLFERNSFTYVDEETPTLKTDTYTRR